MSAAVVIGSGWGLVDASAASPVLTGPSRAAVAGLGGPVSDVGVGQPGHVPETPGPPSRAADPDLLRLVPVPSAAPAAVSGQASGPAAGPGARQDPGDPLPTVSARPAVPESRPQRAEPTSVALPRLGLRLPVRPTELDRDGRMELPARPTEMGWYAYGPAPGDPRGSAVLAGHVDSDRYGIGPLVELREVRQGDRVVVQTSAGTRRFVVTSVRLVSQADLSLDRLFDRDGPGVLRLVTCGGTYLPEKGGYQANLVVTAEAS